MNLKWNRNRSKEFPAFSACPMDVSVLVLLLLLQFLILIPMKDAVTDNFDFIALSALKDKWQNTPPNWVGTDPCSDHWDGIECRGKHVFSITLASMNLTGSLPGDIESLSELRTLDLSYNKGLAGTLPITIGNLKKLSNLILVSCGFSGLIPDSIGSLQELVFLSLNSNGFSGPIPTSIGNLSKLYWLDLAENQLSGPIPVSNGSTPGLDMLVHTKHFHFEKNQLSGSIPTKLFSSNMRLIHLLLGNNQLIGSIPSTLGLVQSLEVVRMDWNSLIGPVPENLNNLTDVQELHISNNRLTGPPPNLTGLNFLNYLDMSNNSFDPSDFPTWIQTLQSLTTLIMEDTRVRGQVPAALFSLPGLQTVVLKKNQLNGTLDIGSSSGSQLQLIDLQINSIDNFRQSSFSYIPDVILRDNPVCQESGAESEKYCMAQESNSSLYKTPTNNCQPVICNSNQTSSPNCNCGYPYTGTLFFRAPSFSDLENSTRYVKLANSLMNSFQLNQLPVDSVSLSNPRKDSYDYLAISLQIFPPGETISFNRSGLVGIGFVLSNQTFKPPHEYGPFYFIGDLYTNFSEDMTVESKESSSNTGIIIGASVGGFFVLLLLLLFAGVYTFHRKRKAKQAMEPSNPYANWEKNKSSGSIPQLKGSRWFSFEDLKKSTNNFSEAYDIGSGGFGKVYRGSLPTGQLVAIKRAQLGSLQGGVEFKNEIELLSRVHHKNLVTLVGFCFERGEQLLVYEYIPNGTLKDSLSGKSGIRLDWNRRLKVALGAARGLVYLHELANPPIIHRDIKSNNILLDDNLNAKVADFGLSKPMGDHERDHVTTQVKGTMGYLDPEYYMTQQLTEKSDVYSFGVLMLELITAKRPIERGKYIVREVRVAMDTSKESYGLHGILDPVISSGPLKGLEKSVDLAMMCVQESGVDRPAMGQVVKDIETIMQLAGLNPNAGSTSTSGSHNDLNRVQHPYRNESFFDYSGVFTPSRVEPQ